MSLRLVLAGKPSNRALDDRAKRVIARVKMRVVELSHVMPLREVEHATFAVCVAEAVNRSLI